MFKVDIGPGLESFRKKEKEDPSDLIQFLSNERERQLNTYFAHNRSDIEELEKKFGKYIYVPLALPKFEIPDNSQFLSWWDKHSIRPNKTVSEELSPETNFSSAEAVNLIQKIKFYWDANVQTDNFKTEFPHLWQQFNELLPFDDILSLTLWSSFKEFKEHRDPGELIDIPMSIRIMLYDENPEETLYIYDNPTKPYECEPIIQLPRSPGTNSRAWNNLRVKHGSIYNPKYKKIMGIVTGLVSPEKYEKLMNDSINIYKDDCIVSKYALENYVNV